MRKNIKTMVGGVMLLVMLLTGCAKPIDGSQVVATLGDTQISLGVANFIAKYQQVNYDVYYSMYMGEDMWSQDLYGDGTTFEESTKKSIMENIQSMYLLDQHTEEYEVALTEEELQKIKDVATSIMSDNTPEALEQLGATQETVEETLRLYTVQNKMYNKIILAADTNVSDEDAAQRTFSYVRVNKNSKQDEEGNTSDYSEEEWADIKVELENLAATAVTAADFETTFTDAEHTVSKQSYGKNEEGFSETVIAVADELKEGDISEVIDADDAYYVIKLESAFDEEATQTRKDEIVKERQEELYKEVLDGFKEATEFVLDEKLWKQVKFNRTFSLEVEEEETESKDETPEEESKDETPEEESKDETPEE